MRARLIGGLLMGGIPSFAMPVYMADGQYYVTETKRLKGNKLRITDFKPFDHTNYAGKVINVNNGRYSRIGDQPQFILVRNKQDVIHGPLDIIADDLRALRSTANPTMLKEIDLVLNS